MIARSSLVVTPPQVALVATVSLESDYIYVKSATLGVLSDRVKPLHNNQLAV